MIKLTFFDGHHNRKHIKQDYSVKFELLGKYWRTILTKWYENRIDGKISENPELPVSMVSVGSTSCTLSRKAKRQYLLTL